MANNRNVWDYRDGLESRMGKMESHVENIFHHVKRIDASLEKQNGRIKILDGQTKEGLKV